MNRILFTVLIAGAGAPLLAQSPPATEPDAPVLDEVVVTAQKRAQSVQDVSASVIAFTPESLRRSGIEDAVSLQSRTPGMVVSTNGPFGQPYIRGVGSDIINPGTDAPVAVFVDGAYQSRPTAAITEFFDVERVEVLKGPQGTLYGRNATGGAMNIVTQDPLDAFGADARATYGNYDRFTFKGALNAPLGEEAGLRVAGFYSTHDGYMRNLLNGRRIDDEDTWGVRGKLKFTFGGASAVITAEHTREDDSRNLIEKLIDAPTLPTPVRDLAPIFGYDAPVVPAAARDVRQDFEASGEVEQTRFNATLTWELGNLSLRSVTGYTRVENAGILDLDATEVPFAYDREADESKSWLQSLQLSSQGSGALQWITGVEYFHEDGAQNFDARLPLFGPPTPILFGPDSPAAGFIWDSSIRTRAASGFVDVRYEVGRTTFISGLRYSWESKEADFSETILDPFGILTGAPATIVIPAQPEKAFRAWTPKVGVEFRPADDTLLYVSATRGFKSGGFNLMNTGEIFDPEKIWSYEAGMKSEWLGRRVRTNVAAFWYDYKDLQVNQFSGVTNLITNAAQSRIKGVEAQLEARPVPALSFDIGAAYLDATYDEYRTRDANQPGAPEISLSGNRMPKAPRVTANVGAEVSTPLAGSGTLALRAEARYQSKTYFDQFNTPELVQGGFTTLDAQLSFTAPSEAWTVALFGRNLTDKLYRQSMVRVDNVFGTVAFFGPPRIYGIDVRFRK